MPSRSRRRVLAVGATVAAAAVVTTLATLSASASDPSAASRQSPLGRLDAICQVAAAKQATVVLVHGAYAETSAWSGEVAALNKSGCNARAISNPLRSLDTDAETVADFAKAQPGPVVLVGHSYGGAVITNAGAEAPNVVGLVYVDAVAPAPGEKTSVLTGADSAINTTPKDQAVQSVPYGGAPAGATDVYLTKHFYETKFAQDLPRRQADQLWATQNAAATGSLGGVSKYAGWETLPSW